MQIFLWILFILYVMLSTLIVFLLETIKFGILKNATKKDKYKYYIKSCFGSILFPYLAFNFIKAMWQQY